MVLSNTKTIEHAQAYTILPNYQVQMTAQSSSVYGSPAGQYHSSQLVSDMILKGQHYKLIQYLNTANTYNWGYPLPQQQAWSTINTQGAIRHQPFLNRRRYRDILPTVDQAPFDPVPGGLQRFPSGGHQQF